MPRRNQPCEDRHENIPGEGLQASGKIPKREKAQAVGENDVKEPERSEEQVVKRRPWRQAGSGSHTTGRL